MVLTLLSIAASADGATQRKKRGVLGKGEESRAQQALPHSVSRRVKDKLLAKSRIQANIRWDLCTLIGKIRFFLLLLQQMMKVKFISYLKEKKKCLQSTELRPLVIPTTEKKNVRK